MELVLGLMLMQLNGMKVFGFKIISVPERDRKSILMEPFSLESLYMEFGRER